MTTAEERIKKALLYLADRCDYAHSDDGVGFNGPDADFGHSLAEKAEMGHAFTTKQLHAAHKMLWKYRETQLADAGFELPDVSELPVLDSAGTITLNGDGMLAIRFDYDPKLVAEVKRVDGRRWNPQGKYWSIPVTSLLQACEILPDFDVSPEAQEAHDNYKPVESSESSVKQIPSDRLELDGDKIAVYFGYDRAKVEAVKRIAGRRWDKVRTRWTVPATSAEAAIEFAEANGLHVADEVRALVGELKATAELSGAAGADIEIDGLGGELMPFQKAGVAYAMNAKRTFIADEMGLGKTVEALATLKALNAFPALAVVPASLKLNWKREAEKWLPGFKVLVIQGRANGYDYADYDLIIINYDVLKAHAQSLSAISFEALIADESHYAKNHKAQRTKALQELAKGIPVRLLLTGTPVLNRPAELLSQLGVLGRLDDLGGFWHFAKRYCAAYKSQFGWDFSGAAHLDELNEKMRATCFVRRNKADVLAELPAKRRATVVVEIDNRAEYQKARDETIAWLAEQAANDAEFLASIADLPKEEQAARKWARAQDKAERARRAEHLVRINALKQVAARGKLTAIREWISDFLESGEKLVVFAHHVEVQKELLKLFPDSAVIRGEDDAETRQANVDRFQNDDDCRLIICSLRAGGVGITLTAASNVAFVELGWTPAEHDQAEDRTHRIGQADSVTAWYLLAENTIDEQIAALIESKRSVVDATTDGILSELVEGLLA